MAGTLLAADVGNAAVRLGLAREGRLVACWELAADPAVTEDEALGALAGFLRAAREGLARPVDDHDEEAVRAAAETPEDAVLSSVVPALTRAWASALTRLTGRRPLVVGPGVKTGLRVGYKDPGEVGADRIADLVAAREAYGAPVMVIDLGTATNVEVIDDEGAFAGGLIVPGMALGARALAAEAARLPEVEVRRPAELIGRSTAEAMRSGIVWGEVARLDGLASMVEDELGYEVPLVLSGEGAELLAELLSHRAVADPTLTLRGLVILHGRNRRAR